MSLFWNTNTYQFQPNLINQICTKPMIKVPGALSDYGLTTEEVMNWMLEWFNANQ